MWALYGSGVFRVLLAILAGVEDKKETEYDLRHLREQELLKQHKIKASDLLMIESVRQRKNLARGRSSNRE